MSRLSCWGFVVCLLVVSANESQAAVPPLHDLVPNTTKGYVTAASVEVLETNWNKTQLGQLMQDPAMQPFVEDFKRQMQDKWTRTHQKLGITFDDLKGVPSGEAAIALILPSPSEVAVVILADVTGRQRQADDLLGKINNTMKQRKAVRRTKQVLNTEIVVYDIPKQEDEPASQMAYFLKDDLLVTSDNLKMVEGVVVRRSTEKPDTLAKWPAYVAVMKRVGTGAGDLAPHARWFVEPFGFADAMRLVNETQKKKGTDMLKILKQEGFTAIEGIGGYINFSVDQYEMLHRTFIYAPGNQSGERFTRSARMLDFPNGGAFTPPSWVPRDVASYATLNVNVKNAFEYSKTLVNEIVGDEVFEDVIDSIKTDENGPRIDVRKDVIALLKNRVTVISDLVLPITPKSERMLMAFETSDQVQLLETIRKWMESDPDTQRRDINGFTVWEVVDQEAELPMVTIENAPGIGDAEGEKEEEEKEEKVLAPNSAVTVAHGHLLIATNIDILEKVLARPEEREMLANSPDYQKVAAELAKLAQPDQFGQTFTRTDDAYRGTYELLRAGKMPESETMLGKMLNNLLGDGKEGSVRTQRIDGSKLPEFDVARRYLGPAGMTFTTEADGWFLTGFTLSKEAQ